jgi:hypothetical protein
MMENESLKAQVNVLLDKLYGRSREKGSYVDVKWTLKNGH